MCVQGMVGEVQEREVTVGEIVAGGREQLMNGKRNDGREQSERCDCSGCTALYILLRNSKCRHAALLVIAQAIIEVHVSRAGLTLVGTGCRLQTCSGLISRVVRLHLTRGCFVPQLGLLLVHYCLTCSFSTQLNSK